ncbi:hypothetical protein [Ignicoccus hospitalis]|uniref:hypothetical protein n=1 Tax=Ignicoccus hospitalis TaxID=160233 RepID=UPI0011D1799C|nr:hypothetical protein [Ignicoccus hospitalis]HIH90565.1 hypothetical protein [Desulfurococcaceae archaeon]
MGLRRGAAEVKIKEQLGRLLHELPPAVRVELQILPAECVKTFSEVYKKKRKKTWLAYLLVPIVGLHYLYLGRPLK